MRTMKHIVYRYMTLLALAVILFTGCRNETDETFVGPQNVTIELSVSAADLTRATPTDMEKAINSLRIYAFNSANNKLAGFIHRQATAPGTPFYMDLELPESGTHNVDFYLVANEAEMADENSVVQLTEKMTKAELEAIRFTGLREKVSLPLYAKKTVAINVDDVSNQANPDEGHEGHVVLAQKIQFDLERPIAKLSVYAAKTVGAVSTPQISGVELLNAGTRQYNYLFPQTDDVLNSIPARANNRALLNTTVSVTKEVAKGSEAVENPANYSEVTVGNYLSEVAVGSSAWNISSGKTNEPVLHIEYALDAGAELKHAYIFLPEVQRNHHIKVCILINAEGQIIINYVVADWDDNEMPNYHFEYPTYSYLRDCIPTTGSEQAKPATAAQMTETSPFKGYFQMTKPATDSWTPTLLGLNGSDCEIRVFEGDTNTEILESAWPIAASDKWYRIEVHPLSGKMTAGEEVNLAISYTATGISESEFLLINGTDQSFYWPYTGTSLQDADYVVITMVN